MKKTASPLLALILALGGCAIAPAASDSGASTANSVPSPANSRATSTPTAAEEPKETEEPEEPQAPADKGYSDVGEPAEQGGTQMTVTSVTTSPTVSLNQSNYRAGSGYETYTDVAAQAGGQYILVSTVVKNTGDESMDLTCGWPIEVAVYDTDARAFDPIDSLHELKDNPECNAKLQPGFEAPMNYAFMVPSDADIIALSFRDTDSDYYADPALVRLIIE